MKKEYLVAALILFAAFSKQLYANNVIITNISAPSTTTLQFDITWENSWYTAAPSNNWDAVWIFVKTQVCSPGSSQWIHADLNTTSGQHSVIGCVFLSLSEELLIPSPLESMKRVQAVRKYSL